VRGDQIRVLDSDER